MIITFCGHSEIQERESLKERLFSVVREKASEKGTFFYLGGYGDFDALALAACKRYKAAYPSSRLIFVTPYLNDGYLKRRRERLEEYDEVLYPDIEGSAPKYAILKRNEWMIKHADLLIAYVDYGWGGAAKCLRYAASHGIPYVNLGDRDFVSR